MQHQGITPYVHLLVRPSLYNSEHIQHFWSQVFWNMLHANQVTTGFRTTCISQVGLFCVCFYLFWNSFFIFIISHCTLLGFEIYQLVFLEEIILFPFCWYLVLCTWILQTEFVKNGLSIHACFLLFMCSGQIYNSPSPMSEFSPSILSVQTAMFPTKSLQPPVFHYLIICNCQVPLL